MSCNTFFSLKESFQLLHNVQENQISHKSPSNVQCGPDVESKETVVIYNESPKDDVDLECRVLNKHVLIFQPLIHNPQEAAASSFIQEL